MHSIGVDEPPYIERFDGEERVKMPPSQAHGLVQPRVAAVLERCAGDRGFVQTEPHMRLGAVDGTDTVFVPDVAFISNERLRQSYPGANVIPSFGPDIAVEIRSPGFDPRELKRKIEKYLVCGTTLVLDVDPGAREVIAYNSRDDVRTFSSEQTFSDPVFSWLQFEVAEIFASLDRFERLTTR
jgi:Uma2 family endonuclease